MDDTTTKSRTTITVEGYEVLEKIVKKSDSSGRIYVPVSWVNKRVKIILLDK